MIASGVGTDIGHQLRKQFKVTGALTLLDRDAFDHHVHHLADQVGESVAGNAQGLHGGVHAGDVALVIGAQNVDDQVQFALFEFVAVVGDVGGQVGRFAGALHQHVLAVITLIAVDEPDRPLALGDVAAIAQPVDGSGDRAGGMQLGLVEPVLELDVQFAEVLADGPQGAFDTESGELVDSVVFGEIQEAPALVDGDFAGPFDDVVAQVATGREGHFDIEFGGVMRVNRGAQQPDLIAGIVHVVLALHVVTGGVEHPGQYIAKHRPATVADGERAGRVDTDKLHLDAPFLPGVGAAEGRAGLQDRRDPLGQPGIGQQEVDEPGTGHRNLGQHRRRRDRFDDGRGDITRRGADRSCQAHRQRTGEVGFLDPRAFHTEIVSVDGRQATIGLGHREGLSEELLDLPSDGQRGLLVADFDVVPGNKKTLVVNRNPSRAARQSDPSSGAGDGTAAPG